MMAGWWLKIFNQHKDGQLNYFGHFEGWTRCGDQNFLIAMRGQPNFAQP
jgi:hypothetical protein